MILKGAEILGPEGFQRGDLAIQGEWIAEDANGREVDLSGFRLLPGMVDLHGDGFERHLAPRRGAMRDLGAGLASVDAELAANGITTAMLAQFFSWEGGMRGPDFAERLAAALGAAEGMLTQMRLQLRLETHMLDDYARFEALVEASGASYVVFNDHLPHDALEKGKRVPRLTGQALKSGRSPERHQALLEALHGRGAEVPTAVGALAARLAARGVTLGSHDDNTAAQRRDWHGRGVSVAEFPETMEAAEAARDLGDAVVLGAPNVVRGGSHKGNVAAVEVLREGIGDAIASDYHYPAMRQAVMRLVDDGVMHFAQAWGLVSEGPARVMGLQDRGTLAEGLRADVVVMEPETGRIGATFVAGRVAHMAGPVAERFLA